MYVFNDDIRSKEYVSESIKKSIYIIWFRCMDEKFITHTRFTCTSLHIRVTNPRPQDFRLTKPS